MYDDEYGDQADFQVGEEYDEEDFGEGEEGEEFGEGEEGEDGEFFYEDELDVDGVEVDGEEWAQPLAAAVKRRSMGGVEGGEGTSLLSATGVAAWGEDKATLGAQGAWVFCLGGG